jgi:hypothetical protein
MLFLLELLSGSGIVLALAIRELIVLRRERERSEALKQSGPGGQPRA